MESFSVGNGSSATAWSFSMSEKPAFLMQFCMVLSAISSYARTSIFMVSKKEIVGSDFLLSIALIIFRLL